MKKLFFLPVLFALFASCSNEPYGNGPKPDTAFSVRIRVQELQSDLSTRSPIPAEEDESRVQSLHLLFFDHSPIAKGVFRGHYTVLDPLVMNSEFAVPKQEWMEDNETYTILAVANINAYKYVEGTTEMWLTQLQDLTEKQFYDFAVAEITGAEKGTGEQYDNSRAILPGSLLMSVRAVLEPGQRQVEIALQRGLVRFDVHNTRADTYDLVSASVWNAARFTPILPGTAVKQAHIERFYGIETQPEDPDDPDSRMKDILGGLYAFENFVDRTQLNDGVTTCLILGIRARPISGNGDAGVVTYYRVNVNAQDGASQNLYRNHVYKLNIYDVLGPGAADERDAWTQNKNNLLYNINVWDMESNGLVLVDEQNTLVLPAKRIVLAAEGETRELAFMTFGEGRLTLLRNECPADQFTVKLESNRLTITATPMAVDEGDRRGAIEVGLNNLRATLNVTQSGKKDKYLILNKSVAPAFPSTGINMIPGGHIRVTSSGPWKAKLVNNSADPLNPGFTFHAGGSIDLELEQSEAINDMFQVYTSGSNDSPSSRYGFLMVWLEEDEDYNQSIVLIQRPAGGLSLYPDLQSIAFSAKGLPPVENNPGITDGITFQVNPGDNNGTLNDWHVELTGEDKQYFGLTHSKNLNGSAVDNTFTIRALGTGTVPDGSNTLERSLNLSVKVWRDNAEGGEQPKVIAISQGSHAFRLSTSGGSVIPVTGGTITLKINADPTLKWSARLIENSISGHPAYLLDGQNKVTDLSGRDMAETLTIGYDKLLTPHVEETPEAIVEVTLDGTDLKAIYSFSQEMLRPKKVDILNIRDSWGQIISPDCNEGYRNFIRASALYGPYGVVKTASSAPVILPKHFKDHLGTIGVNAEGKDYSDVWFINANRADAISPDINNRMREWRNRTGNEGIIVFINDNPTPSNSAPWTNGNLLAELGYRRAAGGIDEDRKLDIDSRQTKVWEYLMKTGPFTGGEELPVNLSFYTDGINSAVDKSQLPPGAVPIIVRGTTDEASLVIDPVQNIIFIGEIQMFQSNFNTGLVNGKLSGDKNKFLGNLVAYIINAAQYGSHFTDNFK